MSSTAHRVKREAYGFYRISWTVDYYYRWSQLRWPRRFSRETDYQGAVRFAKKHKLKVPEAETNA